jgi:hypothetical protein
MSISYFLVRCADRAEFTVPQKQLQEPGPNLKGETTMRFMMLVKTSENSGPPPKELMEAIAKLSEDAAKGGTLLGSGGLGPTA